MLYNQQIASCFAEQVGKHGIDEEIYQSLLQQTPSLIAGLAQSKSSGRLPMLTLPEQQEDLADVQTIAKHIQSHFAHLVVLGTGGSSLNGQALVGLSPVHAGTEVHFMDTVDPYEVECLFQKLSIQNTAFLAISKSGKTLETLAQILLCIEKVKASPSTKKIGEHFYIISDPGDNPLRQIAQAVDAKILNHEPLVGGRFSTFTNVGLLPACVAGLDITAVRKGANIVLQDMLHQTLHSEVAKGAAILMASEKKQMTVNVMMAYVDRLSNFVQWYRQIWSESLGKDGKGTTPVKAMGPLDQHSQLQLYLDGPRDKLFTIITLNTKETGPRIHLGGLPIEGLHYLEGQPLGNILQAEHQATIDTMIRRQCPLRHISLEVLNEEVLGALLMHMTLETILVAGLMGINAFDQPAVEEGKILARKILEDNNVAAL